jgi:hypothetical protein
MEGSKRPVIVADLYDALARTVRIVVKDSPEPDAETLFESTDPKDVADLQESILLEPPSGQFHCMCIGGPALYLYQRSGACVLVTNHHGDVIRCSLWASWANDVYLRDPEKWLSWFDRRGITGPRRESENPDAP